MQFTKSTLAALTAFLGPTALALPNNGNGALKNDCLVNSVDFDHWPEAGMTRHRALFSAVGANPEHHCLDWFNPSDGICRTGVNIQCGWSDELESWHVDASFIAGPVGDLIWGLCVENTRQQWMDETGCRTGH